MGQGNGHPECAFKPISSCGSSKRATGSFFGSQPPNAFQVLSRNLSSWSFWWNTCSIHERLVLKQELRVLIYNVFLAIRKWTLIELPSWSNKVSSIDNGLKTIFNWLICVRTLLHVRVPNLNLVLCRSARWRVIGILTGHRANRLSHRSDLTALCPCLKEIRGSTLTVPNPCFSYRQIQVTSKPTDVLICQGSPSTVDADHCIDIFSTSFRTRILSPGNEKATCHHVSHFLLYWCLVQVWCDTCQVT